MINTGIRNTGMLYTVAIGALGLAWLLAAPASAAPPRVIEIKVPDPVSAPPPPPPPAPGGVPGTASAIEAAPDAAQATSVGTVPGSRSSTVRREQRVVKGEAPATLWGRYSVVQLTEGGETEDFRVKMERAGNALDQDCITTRLVFDFGPASSSPGLPNVLLVAEQSQCEKGGLGVYANELAVALPTTWSSPGDGLVLKLPPVEATASLVRVRKPNADDMHTPPHWVGPETRIERAQTEYGVIAEFPARRKDGQPATAVHLVAGNVTYHLEPEPADGPFGR